MLPRKTKTELPCRRVVLVILCMTTSQTDAILSPYAEEAILSPYAEDAILSPYAEDATLPVPNLLLKYGYPCEIHKVTTTDGYILTIHRIPYGKNQPPHLKRKPVLLSHALTQSSAYFLTLGPRESLGYILADAGYDVWMYNARGNQYSREHIYLNPKDKEYWQFSFHEMGVYDLPATIDYILQETDFNCLYYIGHSQGTTVFFVMATERPEYNKKIRGMIAMAPAVFLSNNTLPIMKNLYELPLLIKMQLQVLLGQIPGFEILPGMELLTSSAAALCNIIFVAAKVCTPLHPGNPDEEHVGVVVGHDLAGISFKQLVHYGQFILSGEFRQMDYGEKTNMEKYGQPVPPPYNLNEITASVCLLYGGKDEIVNVKDVRKLYDRLNNSCLKCKVKFDKFGHTDFVLSENAYKTVYKYILRIFSKTDGCIQICNREESGRQSGLNIS